MIADVHNFITTLESSPAFQTDVAAILSVIPSSVVALAESSPEAFLKQIESYTDLPAYLSAIPTSIINSLETLAAKPIQAVSDLTKYIDQVAAGPEVSAAVSVLITAVPTSVQNAFKSDPISFLENIVTKTALPNWVTAIPAPLQSEIGGVINEGLSIIAADLEGTGKASSGPLPKVTGSGSGGSSNTTKPTTGPVAPFVGAAAPLRSVGAAVVALVAAVGFLVWL